MGKITTIGTGDAFSTGGRFQTCFLIENDNDHFLVDCGANAYVNLVRVVQDLNSISTIFLTHFHGDHYGGIPFILINRRFFSNKKKLLNIYGPKGVRGKIRELSEALYPGLGDELVDQDNLEIHEYSSRIPFSTRGLEVEAIPVVHAPESLPHGFRIKAGGSLLAFSGDTEWTESVLELGQGADLMILECNNFTSIRPGHCSFVQIMENRDGLPENLVLNHFGPEMLENQSQVEIRMADDGGELSF